MRKTLSVITWIFIALLGAAGYSVIALGRGEQINAGWILAAALCTYAIGYRFYSAWISAQILTLNDRRATPCEIHEDGRDFVRTNRWIVFGHHFAAISGPGPLVGPVLAAQFGYLPGTLWILIGVVLGGAVQDFLILVFSIRRDGKSLGEMVKDEIGGGAGVIATWAIVSIIIILIAVLGLVVVKALAHSPWGTFTILATIPIALLMGFYLRYLRPHRVLEATAFGVALLLLSVWGGKYFYENPALAPYMTFDARTIAIAIIVYGLAASILPVWMLLAPRDYLSTFMKLGTISLLALGIFVVLPPMKLPALTRFIDGTGPIVAGKLFPFCFITIACGAISGFHSLIASGTTPKITTLESFTRQIGYGSVLLESFVAIMAMIAAGTLEPGMYFAINTPSVLAKTDPQAAAAAVSAVVTGYGFPVTADQLTGLARQLGEKTMVGRIGGAPTLAVGMANLFSKVIGGDTLMALWYHFAIMFEALFILTTVDAGTRVGRFLLQDFLKHIWKPLGNTHSYGSNVIASILLVSAWGYFMYQGVIDEQGGINSLWPLFGIANQLLAVVALCLATTVLLKMDKKKYVWITLLPLVFLLAVTFTAGLEKIFDSNPAVGFLSRASLLSSRITGLTGEELVRNQRDIFNMYLDAVVAAFFLALVAGIVLVSAWRWLRILADKSGNELVETAIVWLDEKALEMEKVPGIRARFLSILFLSGALFRYLAGDISAGRVESEQRITRMEDELSQGKIWAEKETRRFQSPRCC